MKQFMFERRRDLSPSISYVSHKTSCDTENDGDVIVMKEDGAAVFVFDFNIDHVCLTRFVVRVPRTAPWESVETTVPAAIYGSCYLPTHAASLGEDVRDGNALHA